MEKEKRREELQLLTPTERCAHMSFGTFILYHKTVTLSIHTKGNHDMDEVKYYDCGMVQSGPGAGRAHVILARRGGVPMAKYHGYRYERREVFVCYIKESYYGPLEGKVTVPFRLMNREGGARA